MKFLIKFVLALGLAGGIAALGLAMSRSFYVYPTPETQSAFLKTYDPTSVIKAFQLKKVSSGQSSKDSAAGRKFVTHHVDQKQYFAMTEASIPALFAAMKKDVDQKLAELGARIIKETDAGDRFEVQYEIGQSRGLVAVDPPRPVDSRIVAGQISLPPSELAVVTGVRIGETWSNAQALNRNDWPTLPSSYNDVAFAAPVIKDTRKP